MKLGLVTLLMITCWAFGNSEMVFETYKIICDIGMDHYNQAYLIVSLKDQSLVKCVYECRQWTECQSIDFYRQGNSSTCNLFSKRWMSECLTNSTLKHFIWVSTAILKSLSIVL